MLRCIIVDDDKMARHSLKRLCEKVDYVEVIHVFEDAIQALQALPELSPDVLLLDIEMPDFSGLDLVKQLDKGQQVIFTTSKKDYALEAFNQEATDYLIKPVTLPRLMQALERAKGAKAANEGATNEIFVKANRRYVRLKLDDILYVETKGDYVVFRTEKESLIVHSTLKNIESQLDPEKFVKVHRSYIVNLSRIVDIEEGTLVIEDKVIPISRAQRPILMDRIQVIS
ncbi:MAG: LytTR family DNA-binding domain-containing protein [Bacteroidota bacterium]